MGLQPAAPTEPDTQGAAAHNGTGCGGWTVAQVKLRDYMGDVLSWATDTVLRDLVPPWEAKAASAMVKKEFGSQKAARLRLVLLAALRAE
jgi:hypothetical protein